LRVVFIAKLSYSDFFEEQLQCFNQSKPRYCFNLFVDGSTQLMKVNVQKVFARYQVYLTSGWCYHQPKRKVTYSLHGTHIIVAVNLVGGDNTNHKKKPF
jgi:hypothetical protein